MNVTRTSNDFMGFVLSNTNPIQYFITSWYPSKIIIVDQNWNYISNKSFAYPAYMILLNNSIYITGENNIWKTDQQLYVLTQFNSTGNSPRYRGLYYNSTNDFIYVASNTFPMIYVFNLNLALNDTFSTAPHLPWSINAYNNQLFVGTYNGTMLVIVNKQIIKQFNGCNQQIVALYSILFDGTNNMATSCNSKQIYSYNTTGTYLNKSITTIYSARYIGLDSQSRLVIVTNTQIYLYN
jgi:hypothetical protein